MTGLWVFILHLRIISGVVLDRIKRGSSNWLAKRGRARMLYRIVSFIFHEPHYICHTLSLHLHPALKRLFWLGRVSWPCFRVTRYHRKPERWRDVDAVYFCEWMCVEFCNLCQHLIMRVKKCVSLAGVAEGAPGSMRVSSCHARIKNLCQLCCPHGSRRNIERTTNKAIKRNMWKSWSTLPLVLWTKRKTCAICSGPVIQSGVLLLSAHNKPDLINCWNRTRRNHPRYRLHDVETWQ